MQANKLTQRFPRKKSEHNIVSFITADNVHDIIVGNRFGSNVDFLKIDVVSFDCYVMHSIFQIVCPFVHCNGSELIFPPNVKFAMSPGFNTDGHQIGFDLEKREHIYG